MGRFLPGTIASSYVIWGCTPPHPYDSGQVKKIILKNSKEIHFVHLDGDS